MADKSSGSKNGGTKSSGVVGVCCMDIKGKSKSMHQILKSLTENNFEAVLFGEDLILNKEIEDWPVVDCLIAFFSAGFPLEKAVRYRQLHPTMFCLNELSWQSVLMDRRVVLRILKKNSIPTVKHVIMSRDGLEEEPTFFEQRNFIEVNGKRMMKPFVEKPVDAEDHNVYIYHHSNQGGGSVRLFRKIGNKSSQKHDVYNVRTDGSYIYEEFIATENFQDIKVYTIGEDYAHAEARKAPAVDGIVLRGEDGKEIRQTIQLTDEERAIARKVVRSFKQQICGFDLLRGKDGKSYVCDVNGWSFVKGNQKYFDDFARITKEIFMDAIIDRGLPFVTTKRGKRVLRGVAAVFRHADRTPKQKVKFRITNSEVLEFFGSGSSMEEVKLKNDSNEDLAQLTKLAEISQAILNKTKEGIDAADAPKLLLLNTVLQKGFGGTKVQIKPTKTAVVDNKKVIVEALVVCKWGGVLTHAGIEQARLCGKSFAERIFPAEAKEEFVHSVQVFSNNERRVKRTAEEFAAGLMGLTDISALPHDVVIDDKESAEILGNIAAGKTLMDQMKVRINEVMHLESTEGYKHLPGLDEIENPLQTMKEIHGLLKELYRELPSSAQLCEGETVPMMQQRYQRLTANFYNSKKNTFDTTKVPDIFDYITYDILHNHGVLNHHDLSKLYEKTELLAKFIVPEEYGLEPDEKIKIGALICEELVKRMCRDMQEMAQSKGSKTRLYFTSESHMHTLRNLLLHSDSSEFHELNEPVELSYLSSIVFKIYENLNQTEDSERYQIEVLFSSGTHNNPFGVINNEHRQAVRPVVSVNDHLSLDEFKKIVDVADSIVANYIEVEK